MKLKFPHYFTNPMKKNIPDGGFTSIFRSIGFIGDSLSSGEHESNSKEEGIGYHDYYEYSWGQFIGRKCGLKAVNFSKGGMTAKEFLNFTQNKNDPQSNNIFDKENKCQAYVIALGVNDIAHLRERYGELGFGSLDDVDIENEDNNKDSLVGCYVRIIQKLRKIEPKSRIFVMSIPHTKGLSKEKNQLYTKFRDFLKALENTFSFVYLLDFYKYCPRYDNKKHAGYIFCGGHMSAIGYKLTGDFVSSYIDYIISKNYKDFTQVGFIGKDVHNENEIW